MKKVIRVWIWLCDDSSTSIRIYCLKLVSYFQEAYFIFFIIWVSMKVWFSSSCAMNKTDNKLQKNAVVIYQIEDSTFSACCLCAGRGGVLLRSKRTAFGRKEGLTGFYYNKTIQMPVSLPVLKVRECKTDRMKRQPQIKCMQVLQHSDL